MDAVGAYSEFIKKQIEKSPRFAGQLIRLGLAYEQARLCFAADKRIPPALNKLNRIAVRSVARSLAEPKRSVYVNLFAPTEIVLAFGLEPLSIECFSSFMGGFRIEDEFLSLAEKAGYSETLCSYHRNFLGAAEAGILRPPLMCLTTTLACDANLNTFRALSQRFGVKNYVIDIPYEYSEKNVEYVAAQLEEAIGILEKALGKSFNMAALRRVLECENKTRELHEKALLLAASRNYPETLSLRMFRLFATHILLGSQEIHEYYEQLAAELEALPETEALRILWLHLQPFHQAALQKHFNFSSDVRIVATDFDIDFREPLEVSRPLEALARKMLLNAYNGEFSRKAAAVSRLADELSPDGVIAFNHWGCKQSAGGTSALKKLFDARGVPFLALDGDGLDRKNSPDGQIASRADAFFEILRADK